MTAVSSWIFENRILCYMTSIATPFCFTMQSQSGNRVSTSLDNSSLCWTVFARNRNTAVPAEGNGDLQTPIWPCGETQTMSQIVESYPLTKLNGGLSRLHSADEDAVLWRTSYGSWHASEKKTMQNFNEIGQLATSSSRMRFMSHNWSATKQHLHPQSVAKISCHSVLSGDRIRQCKTSSGFRHKDTDQCL